MLKVAKFGGSSMADAVQFAKVKAIVESDPARRVIVVSAPGKRNKEDHKVTDLLYLCSAHLKYGVSCEKIFALIRKRYQEIADDCGLTLDLNREFDALWKRMCAGEADQEYLASRGEYFAARLMAEYLGYTFLDAALWLQFKFDGTVDQEASYEALRKAAEQMERAGLRVKVYDDCVVTGDLTDREPGLDILAHLDVVPAADNWTVCQPYEPVLMGITMERAALYARCDKRVEEMLRRGLCGEVENLLRVGLSPDAQSMQGIGYKELADAVANHGDIQAAAEEIKLRSRQYAKRQLTWFRRNKETHWIYLENNPNFSAVIQDSTDFLRRKGLP